MEAVIDIITYATDLGRPVYEKLGFEKRELGMVNNVR
jgi:hypothetical protein